MINVTKTYLPDRQKFKDLVDQIFDNGWLTNEGPFKKELQARLAEYLGVKHLLLVSNGTLALQVAYKVLGLEGDILTTPFSFAATTSSIVWEGLRPVFVDIDAETFNLNPDLLYKELTPNTRAIVATHVFGNPCDVDKIQKFADQHGLKVIYDAAHAFGVTLNGRSLLNFGDISTLSFHSTKIFHTIEGGAMIFKDAAMYERARKMINFGITSPTTIEDVGINAKMNEFQAAMGLCVLDEIENIAEARKLRYDRYEAAFSLNEHIGTQIKHMGGSNNYYHFPVIFPSEECLLDAVDRMREHEINPRRYFYPSLNYLPYLQQQQSMPISEEISKRILCLPLSHELEPQTQQLIIEIVMDAVFRFNRGQSYAIGAGE